MLDIEAVVKFLDNIQPHMYQEDYNQYRVNSKYLKMEETDVEIFNTIIKHIKPLGMNTIVRTNSGGISNNIHSKLINVFAYDIRRSTSRISLTIIISHYIWCFVVGKPKELRPIDPTEAWKKFIEICEKHNINMEDYAITTEEGLKIKEEIPEPYISMKYEMKETDEPLYNVHHIDYHSSYPSGLVNKYPAFRPVIQEIYNLRKTDPSNSELYKCILNFVISGCTQSKYHPWKRRWTHIARDVRIDNNNRLDYLTILLEMSGREIIGYNTDGIWYRGEIFHGPGEGDNICEWSNDHTNCIFRSKSKGAYEYIENGKYYPVLRGSSTLDRIKPNRDEWEWGDIYKTDILEYYFDEESELIKKYED